MGGKTEPVVLSEKSSYSEALNLAYSEGMRMLTVSELNKFVITPALAPLPFTAPFPNKDQIRLETYYYALPVWTGTWVKYGNKNNTCTVTENGKSWNCKIPEKTGWYLPDEHGLPFGKQSNEKEPNASHFSRIANFDGPIVYGKTKVGERKRYVSATYNLPGGFGVIAIKKTPINEQIGHLKRKIEDLTKQIAGFQAEIDSLKKLENVPKRNQEEERKRQVH